MIPFFLTVKSPDRDFQRLIAVYQGFIRGIDEKIRGEDYFILSKGITNTADAFYFGTNI